MGIQERKEREREHRREEIVRAAQKIFFEKGLAAATMDEIADAAELSKGTIYLYFKSKEDLYLAVMMKGMRVLYEMFREAVGTGEPTVKLIANISEKYYEFFQKHREYFRMFHFFNSPQFHTQVSDEMRQVCATENQKVWDLVITTIQRGIDEGEIKPDLAPAELGVILWSSANAMMIRIDHESAYWDSMMKIDLESVRRKQNALLFGAVLTDRARDKYADLIDIQRAGRRVAS